MSGTSDLPPGFRTISGRRSPPRTDKEYIVAFRRKNDRPFIDWRTTYRADQLVWVHDGGSWDVIAVREAD